MHGYEMIETLHGRSNNVFGLKAGSLYSLLHSLEEKNYVTSYEDDSSGKTRKYYHISGEGKHFLEEKKRRMGSACTVSILVRFVAYVAINMGCAVWWTTLVPFFSYGKVGAVMNGMYIGFILCVYRNSNILHEEYVAQKRLPRINVTIE